MGIEDLFNGRIDNFSMTADVIAIFVLIPLFGLFLLCCCFRPRNMSICWMNMMRFCYDWCCCRLDCASELDPSTAILRYEEDPPLDDIGFTMQVLNNNYIKAILNTFALELPEYFLSILPTGSLREGFGKILPSTAVLASDFDLMLIPDAAMAGEEGTEYSGNEKPLFAVVEPDEISAGFVWLRLENGYLEQWEKLCIRRQTKGKGCSYLSSHKLHNMIEKTFLDSKYLRETNKIVLGSSNGGKLYVEQNGPAFTVKVVTKTKRTCGMKCCKNFWKSCELERDDIVFYCDFTFALHCPQWPSKSNWFHPERRQHWPTQHIAEEIKKVGCHVVPKTSTDSLVKLHIDQPVNTTYSQSPGLEWRFSFSQPEIVLAGIIPSEAKSAYLALKAVNKRYMSKGFIKGLPSYTLKCVLLQMMEETEYVFWEEPHEVVDVFMKMLGILRQHLVNGTFPHYWIPEINLLAEFDELTIRMLLHKVETVQHKPQAFVADNWLELTRCLRLNCCACCAFGKQQMLGYAAISNILAVKNQSCPCCLIPCSYGDSITCIGPCPYDKLNMDVY